MNPHSRRRRRSRLLEKPRLTSSLDSQIGLRLTRVGDYAAWMMAEALDPLALGIREFMVLSMVNDAGPISQAATGDRLLLNRTAVSRIAQDLEERALLTRSEGAWDRRRVALKTTPKGRQLTIRGRVAVAEAEEAMLHLFHDWERLDLAKILNLVEPPPPHRLAFALA